MTAAFITGITGMVGSHLLDFIIDQTDWKVFGLTRWRSPNENLARHFDEINRGTGRIALLHGDLRDHASLRSAVKIARPSYVFHLAAQSFPRTSFDAPLDTLETNVVGTASLLEAVRQETPEAVVHVCSSSEVFGRVPASQVPINEEVNFHPASPYAISKAGTDLLGRLYAEAYGINTQTTRMFTHTGPRRGDVFAESSFAKQIALAERGLVPAVVKVGNLKSLRTIADVRDAVRAYHLLVTTNPIPGSYYNIGGNKTLEVGQILDYLISLSTLNQIAVEVDPMRLRPIDADLQIPDTTKFAAHTGWSPSIPFEKTMQDLLDYWRLRVAKEGVSIVR